LLFKGAARRTHLRLWRLTMRRELSKLSLRRIPTRRSYVLRGHWRAKLQGKTMSEIKSAGVAAMKKAAIYAWFSTDLQNERSIEDCHPCLRYNLLPMSPGRTWCRMVAEEGLEPPTHGL
jgi:hypothetical protein